MATALMRKITGKMGANKSKPPVMPPPIPEFGGYKNELPLPVQQGTSEVDGASFVRLIIPSRGRFCAPCAKETNTALCGGKENVHLRPHKELSLPAVPWLRVRMSRREWADFIAALDVANLERTVPFSMCMVAPCAFPCLLLQPLCCCAPFQWSYGKEVQGENAMNLVIAKYNKYLFLPRGMVARRQREWWANVNEEFNFIRIDYPPNTFAISAPLSTEMLWSGMAPGTMHTDIKPVSRAELVASAHPCVPVFAGKNAKLDVLCADPRLIPDSQTYYDGRMPEIYDEMLQRKFEQGNMEVLGAVDPMDMLRA